MFRMLLQKEQVKIFFIISQFKFFFTILTIMCLGFWYCAVCLDGSPPAYHLDKGFGAGINNGLVHFDVGPSFTILFYNTKMICLLLRRWLKRKIRIVKSYKIPNFLQFYWKLNWELILIFLKCQFSSVFRTWKCSLIRGGENVISITPFVTCH